ncbi:DUF4062 domain-containing protein [Arthrobacter sp. E3]|uniref:DUF4062 domain-containing protein n=1 Tax=Arthrobacter sp. E3 TaxID=517402 RepID=UPI001A9404E6|nr:DUF4062 domain-containing protein [Arthrobacter sp. E3]
MDRRYQVFVSSTYIDLVDERREVFQALLEMDCLPAGMEMFPAANDDQWTLIQQVIDESDYYVVIVGGRYGSMAPDGISYTEKEFDYAVATGKPILGFINASPGKLPLDKSQPAAQAELDAFIIKVKSRLIKTYTSAAELGSAVSRSLIMTMKKHKAEGWVRGQYAMTPETEAEIANLRAQVSELKLKLDSETTVKSSIPDDLASGTDPYDLYLLIEYYTEAVASKGIQWNSAKSRKQIVLPVNWNSILYDLGPSLINESTEREFLAAVEKFTYSALFTENKDKLPADFGKLESIKTIAECVDDIIVQLFALNLITHGIKRRSTTDKNKYWALTPLGQDTLMKLRAIKKGDDAAR